MLVISFIIWIGGTSSKPFLSSSITGIYWTALNSVGLSGWILMSHSFDAEWLVGLMKLVSGGQRADWIPSWGWPILLFCLSRLPTGATDGCPSNCGNSRGTCVQNKDASFRCECSSGWTGADCSIMLETDCGDDKDNDGGRIFFSVLLCVDTCLRKLLLRSDHSILQVLLCWCISLLSGYFSS